MNKDDFHVNSRYTVTLKDSEGKPRPSKFYVLQKFANDMVVRLTYREGTLQKIGYEDVLRIVDHKEVPKQDQFALPDALLTEGFWKDRTEMQHYSSAPHMGK